MVAAPVSVPPGSLIAGRYVVEHPLGRGGMGSVYAVRDPSSGRRLALKCLRRGAAELNAPECALFQREFHTLAHLSHPCVIEVYDYGVDRGRPYYTMELLDGSDLRELAPMPWRGACRVLRDVASSLGLLHSRRLLHRDLSPRNVRCTSDGRAKLIDFGTMAPMGVPRDIAGTAPYVPPEAIHGQSLDARTELYALGALGYWMLTGTNAYPARELQDLAQAWARAPAPPSATLEDIPEELDMLIMSLLSLDPGARPSHVAEVIERLTALGGLEPVEHPEVASAYLTAPTLVGHSERIGNFHKRLVRAARGRGSSVVIRGCAGSGRSRLLQALTLEAKLCGLHVVATDTEQAGRGELAVMRVLLQRLIESAPALALTSFRAHAPLLGRMFPELYARLDAAPPLVRGEPAELLPGVLQALCGWLVAASQQRALVVAVDDADHADEWSLACLTMLAGDARVEQLVLVTTTELEGHTAALELLLAESAALDLAALDAEQSRGLLGSVFGEVPHLRVVSDWIHALAQGSPRITMELAQYLVDHGIARYERGGWSLPESLRDQVLPQSVEQAQAERLGALSAPARELAEAMALVSEHGLLELDELVSLAGAERADQTHAALGELIAAQVVVVSGSIHALRHRDLALALQRGLADTRRRSIHARLSVLYMDRLAGVLDITRDDPQRGRSAQLLAAHHRHVAGDLSGCWHILSEFDLDCDLALARTPEVIATYEACLAYGEAVPLSPRRLFKLRRALVRLSSTADPSLIRYAEPTLRQLCRDSGRAYFESLSSEPDALQRIRQCVRLARRDYEQTDPEQRGLEPAEAGFELGSCALTLTETFVARNDVEGLRALPGLLQPFGPHAPVFELLHELSQLALALLQGQGLPAGQYKALARLELPLPGLEPAAQDAIRSVWSYWVGLEEAALGKEAALGRATLLERKPMYAQLGAQVRAVYHLFQGNEVEAEGWHKRGELLALQAPFSAVTGARGVLYEGWGYFLCGSVLGLRRVLAVVGKLAARFPGWQAELSLLEGLHALLRGEPHKALTLLEGVDAAGRAQALLATGGALAALDLADRVSSGSAPMRAHPLHELRLHAARALAFAESGRPDLGARSLDPELVRAEAAGIGGLLLGQVYEARARIALQLDDHAVFRKYFRKLGPLHARGAAALRARHDQLGQLARRVHVSLPPSALSPQLASTAQIELDALRDPGLARDQRAQRALQQLSRGLKCSHAFLYELQQSGLRLAGRLGGVQAPDGLEDMLAFYLNAELEPREGTPGFAGATLGGAADMVGWINDGTDAYYPVLLACVQDKTRLVLAIAALALPSQRDPHLSRELVAQISCALLDSGAMEGVATAL
jgi:hypothetical protein